MFTSMASHTFETTLFSVPLSMVDRRSLHCHTTHLVTMQPAMLKTFPVHNELPSSPVHNSPQGMNTTRLNNSDRYSISDITFPVTPPTPYHARLKKINTENLYIYIYIYRNGMGKQRHSNSVTFASLILNS